MGVMMTDSLAVSATYAGNPKRHSQIHSSVIVLVSVTNIRILLGVKRSIHRRIKPSRLDFDARD